MKRVPIVLSLLVVGCSAPSGSFVITGAIAAANDCNGDGALNTQDLQVVVNAVLGTTMNACADVNHDGAINTRDVQAMLNLILMGTPAQLQWVVVQSTPFNNYNDTADVVAVDALDNVIVGGQTQGSYLYFSKYKPDGSLDRSTGLIPTAYGVTSTIVAADDGSFYATGAMRPNGRFGGDLGSASGEYSSFIVKLNSDFTVAWSRIYPGNLGDSFGLGLSIDETGEFLVVTGSAYAIDFWKAGDPGPDPGMMSSPYGSAIYLAKISATDGSWVPGTSWQKKFSPAAINGLGATGAGTAVKVTSTGQIVLTGRCAGFADFGAGKIGSLDGSRDAEDGPFLVKLDPSGNFVWQKFFQKSGSLNSVVGGHGLAIAPNGDIVLSGLLHGVGNFGGGDRSMPLGGMFFARFTSAGNYLWDKAISDVYGIAGSYGAAVDSVGNMIFTGQVGGSIDFGGGLVAQPTGGLVGAFVAKYQPDGTNLWAKNFGGGHGAWGAATDRANNVSVVGEWNGTIVFDSSTTKTSFSAADDGFVVKLSP